MTTTKPFYDLCIQHLSNYDFNNLSDKLTDLGYRTIAINQMIDIECLEINKKKKKGESRFNSDYVPCPINVKPLLNENSEFTVLNRLTVVFSDKTNMHRLMQSENLKKYDLLAVIPKSHEALQYACETLDTDIISFDPVESKLIKFSRKIYNLAVERNIYFEIMYSPAIYDQTNRKNIINRSHTYHAIGKSRNIIITSGAANLIQLRGPYDIINLGLIFGLSEEQSKHSISTACRNVLNRAMGRKVGKAIVLIKNLKENTQMNNENMEVDDSNEEPIQKKLKRNKNNSDENVLLLM